MKKYIKIIKISLILNIEMGEDKVQKSAEYQKILHFPQVSRDIPHCLSLSLFFNLSNSYFYSKVKSLNHFFLFCSISSSHISSKFF